MKASLAILREPEPGKPELFVKTECGQEFVIDMPRRVCVQTRNQIDTYVALWWEEMERQ